MLLSRFPSARAGAIAAAIGPTEQPGFPTQCDAAQGAFGGVAGAMAVSV